MSRHHRPRQILDIYSHGSKLPPLDPPADIAFDVSKVPNPPGHLRYSHDGRHKRMRNWLMEEPAFVNLLSSAERAIRQAVYEKRHGTGHSPHHHSQHGSRDHSRDRRSITPETVARGATFEGLHEGGAVSSKDPSHGIRSAPHSRENSPRGYDRKTGLPSHRILRISSFCVAGHHRSVAFAEELARLRWPEDWEVRVHHRDLGRDVYWYEKHGAEWDREKHSGHRVDPGRPPGRPRSADFHRPHDEDYREPERPRHSYVPKRSEGLAVAERVLDYLR